ncbi:MAG TPA: low molecular weight protein-tyrosine-phosphatase [Burkholderiaceae bacterium]|jgi:protein-tyrosine phosphatase|nr:low molecular weight protein-tyrosine-phosphatase [Burkholderiaceae bacterium]
METILVVCVGNICRSPVAAALLKAQFPEKNVFSAGIAALEGAGADATAQDIASRHGIDLSGHRAQQLSGWMCEQADLILVMETGHQRLLERKYPSARGKIFCLGRYGDDGPFEIEDPYRQGLAAFEKAHTLIDRGIRHWVHRIESLATRSGSLNT